MSGLKQSSRKVPTAVRGNDQSLSCSVLLYHYFHPDDVVSSRLFGDIAMELVTDLSSVVAMPANRSCHDAKRAYPLNEDWNGVKIRRVWRPAWKQASNKGRLGNALFMLMTWTWRSVWMTRKPNESVIIGTDPILAVLVAVPWRFFRPRSRIVFWCHDLYPQAAVADGVVREDSLVVRAINMLQRFAYKKCDVIVDLGECMRRELIRACGGTLESNNKFITITPWALVEPDTVELADPETRHDLFGKAKLGLLYSGNLGRAHKVDGFVKLARQLKDKSVAFSFAGRGQRLEKLREAVGSEDGHITFAGFADEASLQKRLGAADVHLVSLQESWTGTVVPSKFFGALAIGRPVLFDGAADCAIALWIKEYNVGWVLGDQTADCLVEYANDPIAQNAMRQRCHQVYRNFFAKDVQLSKLRSILNLSHDNSQNPKEASEL